MGQAGAALASAAVSSPSGRPAEVWRGQVLQTLPVARVAIVNVGACGLTNKNAPYAGLMATGRAWVTGFEPDAETLAQLDDRHRDGQRHRYWPPTAAAPGLVAMP